MLDLNISLTFSDVNYYSELFKIVSMKLFIKDFYVANVDL